MVDLKDKKPLDENGLAHGEWMGYYSNGQLYYRWNYFHNIAHGFCQGYYSDGRPSYFGYINMDNKIGYWYINPQKKYYLCLI